MKQYLSVLGVTLLSFFLSSCGNNKPAVTANKEAFSKYISSYTSSTISREGDVVVRLTTALRDSVQKGQQLFNITPSVKGSEVWLDDQTVAFRPDHSFKSGTKYRAAFALSKLTKTPDKLKQFVFDFKTIAQDFEVDINGIAPSKGSNRSKQQVLGEVHTADVANFADVRKVVKASQGGVKLPIKWQQQTGRFINNFKVQNVRRGKQESKITISWNGRPLGVSNNGEKEVAIPSLGDFKLLRSRVFHNSNPHVELTFSDRLDASQNLDGLITVGDNDNLNFITKENRIEVYPRVKPKGEQTLRISSGIQNRLGKKLKKDITRTVKLFQLAPQLKWAGSGVIIPKSKELLLPFEAASLGAVDLEVTRIFKNNVLQFLQNNDLSGGNDLKQVGRPIYHQVVPLSSLGSVDKGVWNSYALDLSKLIEPEPGTVYRVEMGFRQNEAVYPCGDSTNVGTKKEDSEKKWALNDAEADGYWEAFSDYYYPDGYNWHDRDKPCSPSYYNYQRHVEKNVLASDIGLIAKRGEVGKTMVAVTNLNTAEPMRGVKLELFDYQKQKLAQTTSDGQGMAMIKTERRPAFILAKKGDERGYLKLGDGESLSLSDFDVSGATVKDGIKGFLYTERGVWRPGDSLFVTMMVQDKEDVLPKNHPVSFTLRNPSGQIYDRRVINQPMDGFYSFRTKTGADSPTGNWRVTARLGGNTFSKSLRIETVKPNRLKVKVNFKDKRLTAADRILNGTIHSQWLQGATAGNLKTDMSMTLFKEPVDFKKYDDYTFNDPSNNIEASTEEIFKGKVNAKGNVSFSHTMGKEDNLPGKVLASFSTRVFEKSGNASVHRSKIDYYPYPNFVGLRLPKSKYDWTVLDRDSTHTVDIVTVNVDGKPVALNDLDVQIYKVEWSWWWEKSGKKLSQYIAKKNVKPVLQKKVSTGKNGKGKVSFSLDDYDWGRFLIKVKDPQGGYSAGKTFYLGWGYGRNNQQAGNPARLTFNSDKDSYKVGEDISINFPSSKGRALVSLETGTKRLKTYWVDTKTGETNIKIKATREMSPNVYAHIMMIQPHGQQQNDRPIRMYGIIPIEVNDPTTQLQPKVDMPDELRPETDARIHISEKNGKPMTYTVAVVDEGLLDLTNFGTPKPHHHFYAREALGVKTWDLYDDVAGAYAGKMNRILSIGGDQELKNLQKGKNMNRFKAVDKYLGPFHLKAGETDNHTIHMPNYVGSVRTMVIAGHDGAYGHAEATTPVRKPVMVLGTLPRVLGPGEQVTLPVSVFAMKDNIKKVRVRIAANDIFKVLGASEKTVTFEQPGNKIANFTLEVKHKVGAGHVEMMAQSGSEKAHHKIDIKVRNPNPPVTNVYKKVLNPGETWSRNYKPVGLVGTNSGDLEVSRIPPIDLGRRLRFLIRYPHGCIEQTTSSVFPQLYLGVIMDLKDKRKKRIEKNVKSAIDRLQTFQLSSGGFSYWPDQRTVNAWGTDYAYHFLLEAKNKGYYVPSDMLQNLKRYQSRRARNWRFINERSHRDDLIQAYRLYTLALANSAELGAMNRLRERDELSKQAAWRLAAAYVLAGQPDAADQLIQGLNTDVADYREMSHTYGSATRDEAMILETLSIMNRRDEAASLMKKVAKRLNSDRWMSTQTTAYSLIGIARFLKIDKGAEKVKVQYDLSSAGKGSISSKAPVSQVPFEIKGEDKQSLKVTNNSNGIVFARLIQEGTPLIGDKTAASNGLTQEVNYYTRDGDKVDPSSLNQGSDIIVEVKVSNPGTRGSYQELALTQIFPSGWEITNSRMDDIKFKQPTSTAEYQDIRDNRVYTYFNLGARKSKTFRFLVNASYLGKFYLPTIETSAMYDKSINARTPGEWVKVKVPK